MRRLRSEKRGVPVLLGVCLVAVVAGLCAQAQADPILTTSALLPPELPPAPGGGPVISTSTPEPISFSTRSMHHSRFQQFVWTTSNTITTRISCAKQTGSTSCTRSIPN